MTIQEISTPSSIVLHSIVRPLALFGSDRRLLFANPAGEDLLAQLSLPPDFLVPANSTRIFTCLHPNGKTVAMRIYPTRWEVRAAWLAFFHDDPADEDPLEQALADLLEGLSGAQIKIDEAAELIAEVRQSAQEYEQRFNILFENSPDAVILIDAQTNRIVNCNMACCRMNGYTRDELIGQDIKMLNSIEVYPDDVYMMTLRAQGTLSFETLHRHKSGRVFPVEVSSSLIKLGGKEYKLGIDRDITERKQAEELLQKTNEQLTRTVQELELRNQQMLILNEMGDYLQSCQTIEDAYTVIGYYAEKLFNPYRGIIYLLDPVSNNLRKVAGWGQPSIDGEGVSASTCWALRRGRIHKVTDAQDRLQCFHIPSTTEKADFQPYLCLPMMAQGEILGVFHLRLDHDGDFQQVTEQLGVITTERISLAIANLRLRESLRMQSIRDPLTGLFNRRYMEETLERELHRMARHKRALGLIMLDIDHFKQFNDTYGHLAGDSILQKIGHVLKESTRGEDIACRFGGEEFILILPEANSDSIIQRAEHLRETIHDLTVLYHGQEMGRVSVSVGISCYPVHGITTEELIRAADAALYQAKQFGRNRTVLIGS